MSFVSALIQPGHWPYVAPIILLFCSNLFMTVAWYGHLKFKSKPLLMVILASWGIAFFEYIFMIPANRWGNGVYSATQLKIIQEHPGCLRVDSSFIPMERLDSSSRTIGNPEIRSMTSIRFT